MDYMEATRQLLKILRQERVSISRLKKILEALNREHVDVVKQKEDGLPTVIRFLGEDYVWRPGSSFREKTQPGKRKNKRKKK